MADVFTGAVSYSGQETTDLLLRPLAIGQNPIDTDYFRVKLGIKSGEKLNYIGAASKLLKTYVSGFNGVAGTVHTQRTLTTYKVKAEVYEDGQVFFSTILEQLVGKDFNDLSDSELKGVIMNLFMNAVKDDIFRLAWLADPYAETLTTGLKNGVANTDYNQLGSGVWKKMFADASTTPSDTQIKRIDVNATITGGYVAQVQTVTLTGTSGTCNVNVMGVNYLATYTGGSITNTDAAFITSHAAALLLRGIVVTGTTTLIFTAAIPGEPFAAITVSAAVSGDLTGSVAATTANTPPSALAAGKSVDILKAMKNGSSQELRAVPKQNKVYLVSQTIYDNYETYLEGVSTDSGYKTTIGGIDFPTYSGIPVIPMKWDYHLDADFPHASGYLPARIHRAILVEKGNLVIGFDNTDAFTSVDEWYNKDVEQNRFRSKFNFGVDYVHNKMITVAY
jgi:hypothetical protein